VGLRKLAAPAAPAGKQKAAKTSLASFKQYREADGRFYFKLVAADGQLLLQSLGFDAPKEAGQAIGRLQKEGEAALAALQPLLQPADAGQVLAALQQLRDAAE
jgi:tryptophanyl-tRNA synthetase